MRRYITLILLTTLITQICVAQHIPADKQERKIILVGGTAHVGNGNVISNSVIVIEYGKIISITKSLAGIDSTGAVVIRIHGKEVYPGIIAPNTILGLSEIGAVRATRDFREVGSINPNVRTITAISMDSRIIPTVRSNGILLAQVTPRGHLITGSSSIIELDGWNWEDAAYKIDDGIHLQWPRMSFRRGSWYEPGEVEKNKKYKEQTLQLKGFFDEAQAYCRKAHYDQSNLRFEAMRGIFSGSKTLFIHANYVREILAAIEFAKSYQLKIVLVGGKDAWMIPEVLVANEIPVILFRIHSLPSRTENDIDQSYKTPFLLLKAGVTFCLGYAGDMEPMGQRNIPFIAGTAVAYGLTKEEALATITSNTAKILGIGKRVGTLEVGKDATLIVSSGDILDMKTNNIEIAFIRGKLIDLNNKQKVLYHKFKTKYSK